MGSKMPMPSCVHSNNFISIITELWPFLLNNANAISHDVEIVIILIGGIKWCQVIK